MCLRMPYVCSRLQRPEEGVGFPELEVEEVVCSLMEELGIKLRKSSTLTREPAPQLQLSLLKAIPYTFSSLPLFCSFLSRLRTAFPLSLWRFCADGRWVLTTVPGRLLWGLGSLYWVDWRFRGPGEGLNNTRSWKPQSVPKGAGHTPS